jgi:nucleotide-binding universal stress UspA family protein
MIAVRGWHVHCSNGFQVEKTISSDLMTAPTKGGTMNQKSKILAAVDLSDYSPAIVKYGVWLAARMNAELVVVNVVNQRDLDLVQRAMAGYESFSYKDYQAEQERHCEKQVRGLIEANCPDNVDCRCTVRVGIPYRELLASIESEKPHLMVVGIKGRSNLADVVVGSTAPRWRR